MTTTPRCSGLWPLLAAAAISTMAGCSSILDTAPIAHEAGSPPCANNAAAYYLPRRALALTVSHDEKLVYKLDFDPTKLISFADKAAPYCLDYLSSPSTVETIAIRRTPDGLLNSISTDADDKSLEIATALIDIGRLAAVGTGARSAIMENDKNPILAKFDFDPFDTREAAAINDALKEYGYCVFVEGATFPAGMSVERYCRNPLSALSYAPYVAKAPRMDRDAIERLEVESRHGVLYRPNEAHLVTVLRNSDPKGRGYWRRIVAVPVEMPNAAPVFSVGIDRAFFTKRTTSLKFDDGVLKDVTLTKGSEFDTISQIPLKIAQAVVSVPTEIIQVRISNVNNQRVLINAQAELLETYRAYQQARGLVVANATTDTETKGAADLFARSVLKCIENGGQIDQCKAEVSGK